MLTSNVDNAMETAVLQASPVHVPFEPVNIHSSYVVPAIKKKLQGYVGFANLPNQVHRKSVRKGFHFTLMVAGESGLGKSTLINTLFNTKLFTKKNGLDSRSTVEIKTLGGEIVENGVKLSLTVVDTPGFGDFINNEESWMPIIENIEARYDAFLEQENRVNRTKIVDNRIHACLYFIAPTGHALRTIDIEFMKRLHTKVNLIPVIAKADTLTEEEVNAFKIRLLDDIAFNKIQIFRPVYDELDDNETVRENMEILNKMPFAVVGSDEEIVLSDQQKVRGRKYPWGIIEVDNEKHNDFVKLRQMLIRTHMEELKEHTDTVLYENYRTAKLQSLGIVQDNSVFKEINPIAQAEEEKRLHELKMKKMETEMNAVFQQKVQEKEAKLKQSEDHLYNHHREMKESLDKQRRELDEKKKKLEMQNRPNTPDAKGRKFFKI